jgi:hypothetical protein
VVVLLIEPNAGPLPAEQDAAVRKLEDQVLSRVSNREFHLGERFTSVAGFVGETTIEGVEELARQREVIRIVLPRKRYPK